MNSPTRDTYLAAALQFEPQLREKEANLDRLIGLAREAAGRGARLIVLPEMATTGYCWHDRDEIRSLVEEIPGPTTDRFTMFARRHDCYLVVGMPEVNPETNIYYNSAALIGPSGVIGVYRKTHSFISEPKWAKDGDRGLPVWDTSIGRLGILICADAEFVEPARVLALSGADVLCFPTNWLGETCPVAGWIARAWENGCYLIAANRYGLERGVQFAGGSCVLDPDGEVIDRVDVGDGVADGTISVARAREKSFTFAGAPEKITSRQPDHYDTLTLNTYLFDPARFHGLYGHRPLPIGRTSRVAVAQFPPQPGDLAANLAGISRWISALSEPVDLVVLPEYALTGYPHSDEDVISLAARHDDTTTQLVDVARTHRLTIVAGYAERVGDRFHSSGVVVDPVGERAHYRKSHPVGAEHDWCTAGADSPPVVDLPLGRAGLLLGSDLSFPETSRALAIDGCDLLVVPAGPGLPRVRGLGPTVESIEEPWGNADDPTHFHLARQRAIENHCYIAFVTVQA